MASWLLSCLQPLPTLIKPTSCCQTRLLPLPLGPHFKNLLRPSLHPPFPHTLLPTTSKTHPFHSHQPAFLLSPELCHAGPPFRASASHSSSRMPPSACPAPLQIRPQPATPAQVPHPPESLAGLASPPAVLITLRSCFPWALKQCWGHLWMGSKYLEIKGVQLIGEEQDGGGRVRRQIY